MNRQEYKKTVKMKKREREKLHHLVLDNNNNLINLKQLSKRLNKLGLKIKKSDDRLFVTDSKDYPKNINSEIVIHKGYPVSRALYLVKNRKHPKYMESYKKEAKKLYEREKS